ncbi:MAG: hypothetical protein GY801_46700 [bacterium]|nr:hypothetical protein [bacterium]
MERKSPSLSVNNRHVPESNPRGNVKIVARYQRLDVVSLWLLPLKGGFAQVMPGVSRLPFHTLEAISKKE